MSDPFIHDLAVVEDDVELGQGTKIWHFAHVRTKAKLGDNVIVGKSSFVDTEVIIGDNVKIQNLVSVYHGVTLDNDVFVGPHVAFTNDLYPRAIGEWEITETMVHNGVSIGANATIICGNDIGENALIAAATVVTRPVPPHGLVAGNPGRLLGWVCYCARKIADKDLESGDHEIICEHCGETNLIHVP